MKQILLQNDSGWLLFDKPVRVITAVSPQDVLPALRQMETAVAEQGLYTAGYLAYEAAAAFGLAVHPLEKMPLLSFGLFTAPQQLPALPAAFSSDGSAYRLGEWQSGVDFGTYQASITRIKNGIAAGDTYQVNHTFPLTAPFCGDERALFAHLAAAQQGAFAAYLDLGEQVICSASPELFFTLNGDQLTSRPMKGTAVRGRTLVEDEANMRWLAQSEKNRAENVMIVDMIRNDMGRVAEIGSVQVPELFKIERYPTVLQMTSTVTAVSHASITDIIDAMFPCASITGAPKVRTMQLIKELEPQPRGVYTGAIGMMGPGRQARFSVAIRTVTIDREQQMATYGVGGGIVWDSEAADEFAECALKAQVLRAKRPSFSLLETMLWQPQDGFFLLARHLQRLADSAVYFQYPYDSKAVLSALETAVAGQTEPRRVRLLVDAEGEITVQCLPLGPEMSELNVGVAETAVDSSTVWLYHKTTNRQIYTDALAAHPHCDDVILWNERGELTESCYANVVLLLDGELLTPPVSSGLLAGTFRQELLTNETPAANPHGLTVQERPLTLTDLARADAVYLINSVRKWRRGRVERDKG